ncbi:MAG: hypothetical protein GXX79_15895 [Actinomycetales bacterium]|nr:hypothetical protein [Actinomycetales bacterium]
MSETTSSGPSPATAGDGAGEILDTIVDDPFPESSPTGFGKHGRLPATAGPDESARGGPWWAPGVVAPSREDPVARAASEVAGGPAGSRLAGATGIWRAVSVLVLFATAMAGLALVEKQHCRVEGWGAPDAYWHACYSDLPALYSAAALGADNRPALREVASAAHGQPPLVGAVMWFLSAGIDGGAESAPLTFFDLSVFFLSLCLLLAVALIAMTSGRRPWDAAHLALAPILITVAFLNYELLAVALLAGALLAWGRSRPLVAGVLLGLAAACRPVYLVVLVAVLALAARSGRWRAPMLLSAGSLAVWMGTRYLLLPGLTAGLVPAWETWRMSGTGYGSMWMIPSLVIRSRPAGAGWWFTGTGPSPTTATTLALLVLGAVVLLVVLLAMTAPRRPRLAHLGLILVVGVLLSSKSLPPQASLLVLPFLALSGFRWRVHLVWALAEVSYFVGVWMHIAAASDAAKGLPAWAYLVLLVGRLVALGWLAVQAVRAIREPELDPVRNPVEGVAGDDPLGGDLDRAPDALVVRFA